MAPRWILPGGHELRILHVVRTRSFAGVERYLTYVAPELARRGHDVTVIGGDPARMTVDLGPAGVEHHPAGSTIDVARSLVRSRRPDLVHTHMTAAEVAAALAWPAVRRPMVTTMHFAHPRGTAGAKAMAFRALEPLFARQIAISEFVGRTAGAGLVVIPNGVPDLGPPPPWSARERSVLVAQRLSPEKDTATAIRAWAVSGLAEAGWTLDVAGAGDERATLERLVGEVGSAGSVRFLGRVDDVGERMRRASLFVATAPAEPFGLSLAEAMAAGVAVVAADGGAHRELLRGTESSQRVPAGDVAALAASLAALASDADRREAAGAQNRAAYDARYSLQRHVDALDELYADVVDRRHP